MGPRSRGGTQGGGKSSKPRPKWKNDMGVSDTSSIGGGGKKQQEANEIDGIALKGVNAKAGGGEKIRKV